MANTDIIHLEHSYALDPSSLSSPVVAPACLFFCDNVSSSRVGLNSLDAFPTVEENVRMSWLDTEGSHPGSTVETTGRENVLVGTGSDVDKHFARYDIHEYRYCI
jgi:hypothetical protein